MKNSADTVNSRVKNLFRISRLVEPIEPLGECVFVNTPLATYLESRQILAVDDTMQGTPRDLQQLSGLFDSQEL